MLSDAATRPSRFHETIRVHHEIAMMTGSMKICSTYLSATGLTALKRIGIIVVRLDSPSRSVSGRLGVASGAARVLGVAERIVTPIASTVAMPLANPTSGRRESLKTMTSINSAVLELSDYRLRSRAGEFNDPKNRALIAFPTPAEMRMIPAVISGWRFGRNSTRITSIAIGTA